MFEDDLKRLREFTKDCRPDMHESDEESIYAEFGPNTHKFPGGGVFKTQFDNADTSEMSYDMGFWLIRRDGPTGHSEVREWFNLAVIVALARMANVQPDWVKSILASAPKE